MRKTIRNGIDRRAVYKFRCTGICGKVKSTYVYERAKSGMCLSCSKKQTDPNQDSLFPIIPGTHDSDELKDFYGYWHGEFESTLVFRTLKDAEGSRDNELQSEGVDIGEIHVVKMTEKEFKEMREE